MTTGKQPRFPRYTDADDIFIAKTVKESKDKNLDMKAVWAFIADTLNRTEDGVRFRFYTDIRKNKVLKAYLAGRGELPEVAPEPIKESPEVQEESTPVLQGNELLGQIRKLIEERDHYKKQVEDFQAEYADFLQVKKERDRLLEEKKQILSLLKS